MAASCAVTPAQAATAPVPAAAAVLDAEIEIGAGLLATGGRHADLAVWAERNGLTLVQARQRWHALRLPVRKREPAE